MRGPWDGQEGAMLSQDGPRHQRGEIVTEWTVERDAVGWSVVAYRDGARVEPRARLYGLSCIAAQVIATELERAYDQGKEDEREEVRRAIFS